MRTLSANRQSTWSAGRAGRLPTAGLCFALLGGGPAGAVAPPGSLGDHFDELRRTPRDARDHNDAGPPQRAQGPIIGQERRPRWALVVAGAGIFTIAYALALVPAISDAKPAVAVPVWGPLSSQLGTDSVTATLMVAGQVGGLVLATIGAVWWETAPVRRPVIVAPLLLRSGGGLTAVLTF
jgi:hypothetical protein